MLINEIKKDNMIAMKEKDKERRNVLSVLITKCNNQEIELKAKGKELTDADVVNIIQKTIKELNDESTMYMKAGRGEKGASIAYQIGCIIGYLPKQLTPDEIRDIISKLEDKSMPNVMKYFRTNYAGQVDMSLVSEIVRG